MAEMPNSLHTEHRSNEVAPPRVTRGEKLFDLGVYGGVNGLGNFLLTIPFAYWCLHGGGARYFKQAGKSMEAIGMKATHAKEVVEMVGTSLGGTAMVIPVYVAENFRTPLVTWLNQKTGNEADKSAVIHEPPKQTWGSLLLGRLAAMATVMVAFRTAGGFFTYKRHIRSPVLKRHACMPQRLLRLTFGLMLFTHIPLFCESTAY